MSSRAIIEWLLFNNASPYSYGSWPEGQYPVGSDSVVNMPHDVECEIESQVTSIEDCIAVGILRPPYDS